MLASVSSEKFTKHIDVNTGRLPLKEGGNEKREENARFIPDQARPRCSHMIA